MALRCVGCCPLLIVSSWGSAVRSVLYGPLGFSGNLAAVRVAPRWNEWTREWLVSSYEAGWIYSMCSSRTISTFFSSALGPRVSSVGTPLMGSLAFWLLVEGIEGVKSGIYSPCSSSCKATVGSPCPLTEAHCAPSERSAAVGPGVRGRLSCYS